MRVNRSVCIKNRKYITKRNKTLIFPLLTKSIMSKYLWSVEKRPKIAFGWYILFSIIIVRRFTFDLAVATYDYMNACLCVCLCVRLSWMTSWLYRSPPAPPAATPQTRPTSPALKYIYFPYIHLLNILTFSLWKIPLVKYGFFRTLVGTSFSFYCVLKRSLNAIIISVIYF